MRFLNRAGNSLAPSVAHAIPLVHMAGAGMAKPLQSQRFGPTKPAFSLQSTGIPSFGIRTVSRGDIHPASC
ncbi:hypothetical protein SOM41_15615 [Enterobacter sp. CFBP8995]|nr:hypothetical protein [Enterobacter sp. CFBP8995]